MLDVDHPDQHDLPTGQGDGLGQFGQIDLGVFDENTVRGRVEIIDATDDRRMILLDILKLERILPDPAIGMMALRPDGTRVFGDIKNQQVIARGAEHVNLADVRDGSFEYVVSGKTRQSGTRVVVEAGITVVDKVVVAGPTGDVVGRVVIRDGMINYWKRMFHDSLSGVDASKASAFDVLG
ncbi:MAG: hypothetical protein LC676_15585 [Loktanella sp.]|nr:hypothetical protein [Loktanella sp.]